MAANLTSLDQLTYTYALAAKLMQEHGLTDLGWRFDFSTSARRVAVCKRRKKLIEFSLHRLGSDKEIIKDTILHEIAHALCEVEVTYDAYGKRRVDHHGPTWKAMCIKIGAKPERLISESVTSKNYNFEVCCSQCDKTLGYRYRVKQTLLDNNISNCCRAKLVAYDIREDS